MSFAIQDFIARCQGASETDDAQAAVAALLREVLEDPELPGFLSGYRSIKSMADMAFHRSPTLTLLAAAIPPGFKSGAHNHNLWSVVGVCSGQEDNEFYERDGDRLRLTHTRSVVGPGAIESAAEVIHAIRNPLDEPLLALHAYGGDLLATPRSSWDPETGEEIPFAFDKTIPAIGAETS